MSDPLIDQALDAHSQAARIALAKLDALGPADAAAVNAWLEADPLHRLELDLAEDLLLGPELTAALKEVPEPRSWRDQCRSALDQVAKVVFAPLGVAAVGAFAALMAAVLGLPVLLNDATPEQAQPQSDVYVAETSAPRSITLADGGVIHLNAASQVRVTYASEARQVHLMRGEALFEVASDQERPFVVQAGDLTFTVLGTVFNVDRRTSGVELSVFEGAVGGVPLSGPSNTYSAGQGARYAGGERAAFTFDPVEGADWRRGWLEARGLSFGDTIEELQRYSGRMLLLEPGLEGRQITGRFPLQDPETALRRLAETQGLMVDESATALYVRTR